MRYYISDLHFFHESLNTQMDCRGFKDAAQMNAYMIKQWNSRVRTRDEVVILGDFSVGKAEQTNEILNQLNGRLYMIKGNHDRYLKESEFNKERFVWIKPYAEMHDNRRKVVLSHYPIFCYNGQYRRNKKGEPLTYMLYGHVHDTLDEQLVRQFCQITRQVNLGYGDFSLKNTTFNTADIILDDGDFIADTITVNGGTISLSYGDCDFKKASLSNTTIKSADGDISMNNLYLAEKVKLALSYGDAMLTLNDSTKNTAGFNLITHYGTINTSSLTGSKTEKDDEETFKAESKDGKTVLNISSEDGDITIK